jgi:exonuclease III
VVGAGPDAVVVCGDMNIAPADADVFDPAAYVGQTHFIPPERAAWKTRPTPDGAERCSLPDICSSGEVSTRGWL